MPTSPERGGAVQTEKWDLWAEIQTGYAIRDDCAHCGLPIYTFNLDRTTFRKGKPVDDDLQRWYHFLDPKGQGFRPMGANDATYDLVRSCATALRHQYVPENELDPRWRRRGVLRRTYARKLTGIDQMDVATP